jgi:Flp pilus assembly protein protease CpaA
MTADATNINEADISPDSQAIQNPLGAAARGQSLATSVVVATLVAGGLGFAHERAGAEVPGFWAVAAFLVVIAQQDTWRRKIPNWATGCGLLGALALHGWQAGLAGIGTALLGIAAPFVLLLAPFAARVVGAGDVKAMMVLGGFWGVSAALGIMVWTVVVTGVAALALVTIRGELIDWFRRWGRMIRRALLGGGLRYEPPGVHEAAAIGLPVGTAIGLAVAVYLILGAPWQ